MKKIIYEPRKKDKCEEDNAKISKKLKKLFCPWNTTGKNMRQKGNQNGCHEQDISIKNRVWRPLLFPALFDGYVWVVLNLLGTRLISTSENAAK